MPIPQFDDEQKFREWYLGLKSAQKQVLALNEWRQRQVRIVGALDNLVRLLASEQYTQIDHFLLELLQNADDNDYADKVSPELRITLTPTSCTFECNEQGFTPDNVFAISYAAASTKHRAANSRTFIGEKGIGFKSIFGVASAVEIHSNDFHFELRDKEYILPHWLGGHHQSGSRIVIRFKDLLPDIAKTLSSRLAALSRQADQFVLFLQQLESLVIDDQLAGYNRQVKILRDHKAQRHLVENEGKTTLYHIETFPITFPESLVRDRFDHLAGEVVRDIVVAVPLPADLPKEPEQGQVFCYLPTKIKTGFPFHIQLDAKTTTNRENIESCDRSSWNRGLVGVLPKILVQLFLKLRDHSDFRDHLPRYLANPSQLALNNDELVTAVQQAISYLKNTEIALARNGKFTAPAALKFTPEGISPWLATPQYEPHLPGSSRILLHAKESVMEGISGAFLHPEWRKYAATLDTYGCEELDTSDVAMLLQKGGTPSALAGADETISRKFLMAAMQLPLPQSAYYRDETAKALRSAPIFPLRTGKTESWGPIEAETMVISSEARQINVPRRVTVINPAFTFTPGGTGPETVRSFNERFRNYLTDTLKVLRYSEVEYLDKVVLPGMQVAPEIETLDHAQHLQLTERWLEIYYRIWRRKSTIIDDTSEQRWQQLLKKISDCYIPVSSGNGKVVKACLLKLAFLTEQMGGLPGIEAPYRPVGAPFVDLVLHAALRSRFPKQKGKRRKEVDWADWGQFLRECDAEAGPYLMSTDLGEFRTDFNGHRGTEEFWSRALSTLSERDSSNFRVTELTTTTFDSFTSRLISQEDVTEVLTTGIAKLWDRIKASNSEIGYLYGQRYKTRWHNTDATVAKLQIGPHLRVLSDRGILPPSQCFLKTPENEVAIGGILPLVDPSRYSDNADFLTSIGVQIDITFENLEQRVQALADNSSSNAGAVDFTPYLRIAARLGQRGPRERNWIRTARIFYHAEENQLLDYSEWSKHSGGAAYPEDLTSALSDLFSKITGASLPELFKDLAALGDLMPNQSEVIKWLLRLADHLTRENLDAVALEFASFIRDNGVTVAGNEVHVLTQLPLAWDATPPPLATASILLLPQAPVDRSRCETALRSLCWPLLSECKAEAACDEEVPLTALVLQQLRLALQQLFASFDKTNRTVAERMRQSRLGLNMEHLDNVIVPCKGLSLNLTRDGQSIGEYDVPFWWHGPAVFIDVSQLSIPLAVASVLDADCGVTTTPFFEAIFASQEGAAKALIAPPPAPPTPPTPTPQTTPTPGGTPPTPGGGPPPASGPHPKPPSPKPKPTNGPRKRLYSYVLPASASGSSSKGGGEAAKKRADETEAAAVKRFKEFLNAYGVTPHSVEDQDLGYDFEVVIGERKLFVELKGSRDRWKNWEHDLTPNEFRAAQEKGDDYILCIAERVFEPDGTLVFIQNPWSLADGFLFDSPWRLTAVDPAKLFSCLEDSTGAPPQRPEES